MRRLLGEERGSARTKRVRRDSSKRFITALGAVTIGLLLAVTIPAAVMTVIRTQKLVLAAVEAAAAELIATG